MIEPLFTRRLTAGEIERGAILVPRDAVEELDRHLRGHPDRRCARVDNEARAVRLSVEDDAGGEGAPRAWLENALPAEAREGDEAVVHEVPEEYCISVHVRPA